ncbi:MAG: hypothetical protein AABX83_03475 [Nanoarchaeota archaeon]
MGIKIKSRQGVFFSIDALIALGIIISVIIILYPSTKDTKIESNLHYDVISSLSSLKIGEVDNSYINSLISQGYINDTNKSVLEQIGEFSVINPDLARALASSVLSELKTNTNIGIWYGNKLIYGLNKTPIETADNIETARQTISGIGDEGPSTGFVSKAWLKKIESKKTLLVIRGDLMCGKWTGTYCGPAQTDLIYNIDIPLNSTILNAFWLAEPTWVGQPTKLTINSDQIYNGDIQYYVILNITQYLHPGKNIAVLNSTTGGDDGASHIVIEYNTSDLQTFVQQDKFYFNNLITRAKLYQEKGIIIQNPINSMFVQINTSDAVTLSIRVGAANATIGTKSPQNGIVNFTSAEILGNLTQKGLSYSSLNNKYFFVVVQIGQAGSVKLDENSYVEIQTSSQTEIPFGSIDITQEIKINQTLNKLQNTFYRNLVWKFFLPQNSIPIIADWQLGWLWTGNSITAQTAKANGITLYNSPPDPFIPAFSRFGYTPNTASGVFKEKENNFTLDFGSNYAVSNESSYGALTYFIRSFVNFDGTFNKAKGGIRTIEFETGETKQFSIGDPTDPWDPSIDAVDDAVERLIAQLDADKNGKIDVILKEDNLEIETLDISGVPYLWSTEVQVRIWN